MQFIREVYWEFEYEEVVTPNIYNFDLWKTSGHADHYKQNMFSFDIEKQEFGLKPMNCPGQSQPFLGFLALTRKSSAHQQTQLKFVSCCGFHSGMVCVLTDGHICSRVNSVQPMVCRLPLQMLSSLSPLLAICASLLCK